MTTVPARRRLPVRMLLLVAALAAVVAGAVVATRGHDSPPTALDARSFGVHGDGHADDTAALQRAIDAASGRVLRIEPGRYLTTGVVLDGPVQVVATGATLVAAGGSQPLLSITRPVEVDGLGLDGDGRTKPGISVTGAAHVVLQSCTVQDITSDSGAILLTRATNFRISGCTVSGSSQDGIHLYYSSFGQLDHNTITASGRHGIEWWGGDSARPTGRNGVQSLQVLDNSVTDVGQGGIWGSLGQDITVRGNTVQDCGDVCLDAEGGSHVVMSGNTVHNARHGGITLFFAATDVTVTDNSVVQDPGWGNGIQTYGSGASTSVVIAGNTISTSGSTGIYAPTHTLREASVTSNVIDLRDGGTAIDIADAWAVRISGNRTT